MTLSNTEIRDRCYRGIVLLGTVMTAVVTLLRVLLTPVLRDSDTGRFAASVAVVAAMALTVAAMALLASRGNAHRVEVSGKGTLPLALSALFAGALIGITGVWDLLNYILNGVVPAPATPMVSAVTGVVLLLSMWLMVAAGAALIFFGLQVIREGGTRIGMRAWSALLPTLWLWFRLARYEMSYASAISLDKSLADFGMFVLQLLFLFKLARYVSGIGKTRPGSLMVYAMGAAMTSISGSLSRLCMYLLGDTQAYLASQLAGLPDFGIGVLALVFAWTLYTSRMALRRQPSSEESSVSSDGLLF